VLGALVESLRRLDYPAAKLDIKLILEEVDGETIEAAYTYDLPGNFEIVVVPELQPRTKPKALNYALPLARGDYLVIYDAEDRPERDQLRKALAAFREGPPNLACMQARLNLYNSSETGSPSNSPSNIPLCLMGCCRCWHAATCPSRSAAPQIISASRH
jgi:cellulose synthase/poly-beta-1,6-N-acetylglucosamine synthase-like glycosyltransferase